MITSMATPRNGKRAPMRRTFAAGAVALLTAGCSLIITPIDPDSRLPPDRPAAARHFDRVIIVVLENEDDVTTPRGEPLGRRLEDCLQTLWEARVSR